MVALHKKKDKNILSFLALQAETKHSLTTASVFGNSDCITIVLIVNFLRVLLKPAKSAQILEWDKYCRIAVPSIACSGHIGTGRI